MGLLNALQDANTAFVSITLFNMLRIPFNQIPMTLIYFVQAQVSLDRLNREAIQFCRGIGLRFLITWLFGYCAYLAENLDI